MGLIIQKKIKKMKKLLIVIVLLVSGVLCSWAELIRLTGTSYCIRERGYYGWTDYSSPTRCNIPIVIDTDEDLITIYSARPQIYNIVNYVGSGYDNDGDYIIRFQFVDQDYDRGTMRLVERRSGKYEVYIDFQNVSWVYSVTRR